MLLTDRAASSARSQAEVSDHFSSPLLCQFLVCKVSGMVEVRTAQRDAGDMVNSFSGLFWGAVKAQKRGAQSTAPHSSMKRPCVFCCRSSVLHIWDKELPSGNCSKPIVPRLISCSHGQTFHLSLPSNNDF